MESGGRSVGTVRLRTKATEFFCLFVLFLQGFQLESSGIVSERSSPRPSVHVSKLSVYYINTYIDTYMPAVCS
jgi:hypothetical protein